MQTEENTLPINDEGSSSKPSDAHSALDATDDDNGSDFRSGGRFAKRNYRKRSNSSGSSSPMIPDYHADASAANTETNRNALITAAVVAENASEDAHFSDDEHSNSVDGTTTESNSSSSSSVSSSDTSATNDEMMYEECSSDSEISEETINKSYRVLNHPMPK